MIGRFLRRGLKPFGFELITRDDMQNQLLVEHELKAFHTHSIVSVADHEGRILDVNDLFVETLGYCAEEMRGRCISDFYSEGDAALFGEIHATLLSGRSWRGQQRLRCKDGNIIWVHATLYPLFDAYGNHVKSVSVRTDITATKQSQHEREMQQAMNLFQDELFMFTTDTLRYTYMNEAAKRRWGWSDTDYIDKTLQLSNPSFDRDTFLARAAPLLAGEVEEICYTSEIYDDPYEVKLQLMTTASGKRRFVSVERNITDQLALEKAKNEFTATVTHELRSPLTSIKGGIGLVLSGAAGDVPDKVKELLEISHRNADRLVLIVNDMLDLEKIAAGQMSFQMQDYDAAHLFSEAEHANAGYLEQFDVTLQVDCAPQARSITCDPNRMLQVLTNLLTNAAKFSKPGGNIRLALEQTPEEDVVIVEDFGQGIPAEAQASIFERFTQAKGAQTKRVRGTGLGLSIVKAIVEMHDGRVDMCSIEGEGTTFRIYLPRRAIVEGQAPQQLRA
ncbi:ATP-binding protein [Sulfitobacter sp. S190]|uniref:ATP-binding protein n=1 Tax=Sulfitobacter sp. S190 TaxID=2867022 RepID=UPI0021A53CF4|nr:ATP-binding protein [Sulfitobacter sp. S190]